MGDHHVPAADGGVGVQGLLRLIDQVEQRHVGRDGGQPQLGAQGPDPRRILAEQPGELHPVVAHGGHLPQGTGEIRRHFVPHGI